jgi:hypothetical protein
MMKLRILYAEDAEDETVSVEFTENPALRKDLTDVMHKWGLTYLELSYTEDVE